MKKITSLKSFFSKKNYSWCETPLCCGSRICYFPPTSSKRKINNKLSEINIGRFMVIVLGEKLPNTVRKLCKGVGLAKNDKLTGNGYWDHNREMDIDDLDDDEEDEINCTLDIKPDKLGLIATLTRLTDDVFFLEDLDDVTDKMMRRVKRRLKKGQVILAISVTEEQEDAKEVLVKNKFKVVKKMTNPGSMNELNLHIFKKGGKR